MIISTEKILKKIFHPINFCKKQAKISSLLSKNGSRRGLFLSRFDFVKSIIYLKFTLVTITNPWYYSVSHCVKSVQIRSFAFSCIGSKYKKIRTKKVRILDTFHAVSSVLCILLLFDLFAFHHMREFYIRQFRQSFVSSCKICVNANLLNKNGNEYQEARKLITPSFTSSVTANSFVCF